MGVDSLARRLGLFRTMQCSLPPLGVELDNPRLDGDATRAKAPTRIPLPTTVLTITKK